MTPSPHQPSLPDPARLLQIYRGLVEVSVLINEITEYDALLSAILEVARSVFQVEASSLFLLDAEGALRLEIARGPDGLESKADIIVPRGKGISGWVLENNLPLLVEDAYEDERFFREADRVSGFTTRSILCVPLSRDGHLIGVLQVLNPCEREAFDQTDLDAFVAYSHLVATAINRLRDQARRAEQARVEQEVRFASEIQQSFLPAHLPKLPGFDAAAFYRPAKTIGGDFYDIQAVGEDEVWFVIGDVSGKGIPASLLMAQAVSYLRLLIRPGLNPAHLLGLWNDRLSGTTVRGMFITAIVGRFLTGLRKLEFACAGHPSPLEISAAGVQEVATEGAPPVGILPGTQYALNERKMDPGQWLVFATDGLMESFDDGNVALGQRGMRELLRSIVPDGAAQIVEVLREGEARHRKDIAPHDDLTILVLGIPR